MGCEKEPREGRVAWKDHGWHASASFEGYCFGKSWFRLEVCEKMSCDSVRIRCCRQFVWAVVPRFGGGGGSGRPGAEKLSWKNHSKQGTGGVCVAGSDMWMGNGNLGWRRKPWDLGSNTSAGSKCWLGKPSTWIWKVSAYFLLPHFLHCSWPSHEFSILRCF